MGINLTEAKVLLNIPKDSITWLLENQNQCKGNQSLSVLKNYQAMSSEKQ